jgi:hypothetical protein
MGNGASCYMHSVLSLFAGLYFSLSLSVSIYVSLLGFLVCQCDSLPHSTLRDPLAGDPTGPHELGEFSLIQDVLPEVGCPILEGLVEDARLHVESWTNRTAGRDEPAQHIL